MKAPKESKEKKQLSADLNIEDHELLEKVISEYGFSSKREGLAFIFNGYRQSINPTVVKTEKTVCVYLFGAFCCKDGEKIKETNSNYCAACMQAEKLAADAENENLPFALKVWEKLTGQRGFINWSVGLAKIEGLIAQKNEDVLLIKEKASVCPKCGFKILKDDEGEP